MRRGYTLYLENILASVKQIFEYADNLAFEALLKDIKRQDEN